MSMLFRLMYTLLHVSPRKIHYFTLPERAKVRENQLSTAAAVEFGPAASGRWPGIALSFSR